MIVHVHGNDANGFSSGTCIKWSGFAIASQFNTIRAEENIKRESD